MKRVIAGIGIPGSGKSTFLLPYALKHEYVYISPDELRQEISGDARIQSDMRRVWDTAYARLNEALQKEETVVFDATQYKKVDRLDFIKKARMYGATEIIGVYFDVSLETAKVQNQGRSRVVPLHAIERMHECLTENPPTEKEGFTEIVSPEWLK